MGQASDCEAGPIASGSCRYISQTSIASAGGETVVSRQEVDFRFHALRSLLAEGEAHLLLPEDPPHRPRGDGAATVSRPRSPAKRLGLDSDDGRLHRGPRVGHAASSMRFGRFPSANTRWSEPMLRLQLRPACGEGVVGLNAKRSAALPFGTSSRGPPGQPPFGARRFPLQVVPTAACSRGRARQAPCRKPTPFGPQRSSDSDPPLSGTSGDSARGGF